MSDPSDVPYLQEQLELAGQAILALEREVAELRKELEMAKSMAKVKAEAAEEELTPQRSLPQIILRVGLKGKP